MAKAFLYASGQDEAISGPSQLLLRALSLPVTRSCPRVIDNRCLDKYKGWLLIPNLRCPGQVENEFGFVGPNEKYMRHLVGTMRASLGNDALIYTTDPPPNIAKGSLPGDEVFR